jgi:hypothetical protein
MDRTSITRALAPLERDGLIHSRPGADKRIRIVSVTNKGRKLVEDAEPKWCQAQEALLETIGVDRWRGEAAKWENTVTMRSTRLARKGRAWPRAREAHRSLMLAAMAGARRLHPAVLDKGHQRKPTRSPGGRVVCLVPQRDIPWVSQRTAK